MRNDVAGFFWDDTPAPKVLKEKIKRTPPEPTWLQPDYLPGLEEALAFTPNEFTVEELVRAQQEQRTLIVDVESYPNYFLVSFMDEATGKIAYFEDSIVPGYTRTMDLAKLRWMLTSFHTIGFNSLAYDLPILEFALAGERCEQLNERTKQIIGMQMRPSDLLKAARIKRLRCNHVDIIEVAPLSATLKIYAARLHSERLQDLPFSPDTVLSTEQAAIVRLYNVRSDLPATLLVYKELKEQIDLRAVLSYEYGMDLRSKSDAQIAEAVIVAEVTKLNGVKPTRPEITFGHQFRYVAPDFLQYKTPLLQWVLNVVTNARFEIAGDGTVWLPEDVRNLKLTIGGSTYQMGMGGLHSTEQSAVHYSTQGNTLRDRDVVSYYPQLILNCGMYPEQLGQNFLRVYQRIVTRRVHAKANKDKVTADSLKITANGTFGKTGSPWSALYAPHLMIQVTLTGQLCLLMLIERLELAGIPVVSANTDGIVINCPNNLTALYEQIILQWEKDTNLTTEETVYAALYSRDVNNYIAVKPNRTIKAKGAYSNPWASKEQAIFRFHKNPVNLICTEAVEAYVTKGVLPSETIRACKDPRKFITVRTVKGGAYKDGVFFPKCVRWYYGKNEQGEIVYARSGNRVARTEGAVPFMDLSSTLPEDIDYDWYIREAVQMVQDLGLAAPENVT